MGMLGGNVSLNHEGGREREEERTLRDMVGQ
jgi:hypothetical protein